MSVFSWWSNVLDELQARTSGAQAKAEHESQRQWRNMAEDGRRQAAWNSTHEAAREPARGDALEAEAWAERNAYWSGHIGQIEGRAMTARERLEWEVAKKYQEAKAAIAHEIEVMVDLGCSPDLAKATVWAGDGNDKGAVAKLGKEFHALERELAALVQETAVEPAQAPEALVEHDGLDAARELLGVQAKEAVAEARPAAPDVIPDFEQTPVVMTEGVHGNGWRYGLAPGRVNAPVASPEAEAAEVRRTSLVAREQAEQMRLDQKAQVKAGLEEIRQQAAVEPPPAEEEAQPTGEEAVVDSPALPSYYHYPEGSETLVASQLPDLVPPGFVGEGRQAGRITNWDLRAPEDRLEEEFLAAGMDPQTMAWDPDEVRERGAEIAALGAELDRAEAAPLALAEGAEAPTWEANQQHEMAKLSGLQEVADREGWEPEPEAPAASSVGDALDQLGTLVSEMSPEERAAFLADDDITIVGLRGRLTDPKREPILGPAARVTADELREEARAADETADARLNADIEASDKARLAEIETRDEVLRQWAEPETWMGAVAAEVETYDGLPITPDPAAVSEAASRTLENDQMKAEQARQEIEKQRRARGAEEEHADEQQPGQEPQL